MSKGLGRGLNSLIPSKVKKVADDTSGEVVVDTVSAEDKNKISQVAPDKIKANPSQPRRNFSEKSLAELSDSIKQYGIIQPLIVSRVGNDYELIAGERRLRASKLAGLETVPVIVREADEQEKLELALIENVQREDLNPIEMALAYRKLIDEFNISQEELGRRLGKSRPVITNTLRMLNLPEVIQQALIENKIFETHGKLIAGLSTEEKQMELFNKILREGLTAEDTMEETRRMGGTKHARIKINYADKDYEFSLREFFGTKAEIKRKSKGRGEIIVYFFSDDELGEIINKVKK